MTWSPSPGLFISRRRLGGGHPRAFQRMRQERQEQRQRRPRGRRRKGGRKGARGGRATRGSEKGAICCRTAVTSVTSCHTTGCFGACPCSCAPPRLRPLAPARRQRRVQITGRGV